ncbi:MAG: hypothetical protein ACHQ1G_11165, partial [Planctomycetota bacterium]
TFESWNSEERMALPPAVVLTLTVAPPLLSAAPLATADVEARPQRTFVRIVQLVQADDVLPRQAEVSAPGTPPGTTPQTPGR